MRIFPKFERVYHFDISLKELKRNIIEIANFVSYDKVEKDYAGEFSGNTFELERKSWMLNKAQANIVGEIKELEENKCSLKLSFHANHIIHFAVIAPSFLASIFVPISTQVWYHFLFGLVPFVFVWLLIIPFYSFSALVNRSRIEKIIKNWGVAESSPRKVKMEEDWGEKYKMGYNPSKEEQASSSPHGRGVTK